MSLTLCFSEAVLAAAVSAGMSLSPAVTYVYVGRQNHSVVIIVIVIV